MAGQIASYDSPQVEARTLGTPEARIDPGADRIGADIQRNLQQASAAVGDINRAYQEQKQQANVAHSEDALGQLQAHTNDTIIKYKQTKGKDAVAQAPNAEMAVGDKLNDLANNYLTNDEQRRLFQKHANDIYQQARQLISAHSAQQADVAKTTSFNTLAKSTIDNVATTGDVAKAIERMDGPLSIEAARHGLDDESALRFKEDFARKAAKMHIEALMKDPKGPKGEEALAFILGEMPGVTRYEEVTGKPRRATVREFLGADGIGVEKEVQATAVAQRAETAATQIMAQSRVPGYGWVDEAKAIHAVEAMPDSDPILKEHTRQVVTHLAERDRSLKKQAGEQKLQEATAVYIDTGNLASPQMAAIRGWMKDPANGATTLWHQFVRGVQADIRAERSSNAEERRLQKQLDDIAVNDFKNLPVEDRDKLDINAWEGAADASRSGRARLGALKQQAHVTVTRGEQAQSADYSRTVESIIDKLQIPGDDVDSKARRAHVKAYIDSWAEQETAGGHKPSVKQLAERAMEAKRIYLVPGMIYGTNEVPGFELTPEQRANPKTKPKEGEAPAAATPASVPGKIRVLDPSGSPYRVDPEGIDAWLKGHPGWRKG